MQIIVNGERRQVPDETTAWQLIQMLELQSRRLAMEVNAEIVPRSRYVQYRLNHGDSIEIVHAIGGG